MKKLTIVLLLISSTCFFCSCGEESSKKTTKSIHKDKIAAINTADTVDKTIKEDNIETNTDNEVSSEPSITDDRSIDELSDTSTIDDDSVRSDTNIPIYTEPEVVPYTNNINKKIVRIFYHNPLNDNISYFDKEIEVTDGALTKALVDLLKDSSINAIPEDAYVKSANLDKNNDMITINFGDKFIDTTRVGSTSEYYVLTATINTFCYNFGVSKAIITLNGNPYESGHVSMAPGQAFSANYSECFAQ